MSEPPRRVHVTKAADVKTADGQTEGMVRQSAIVGLSPHVCATLMRAGPHSSSAIHHHGAQDTVVYAVSGQGGSIVCEAGKTRQPLGPGDFALIPAYAEHQEVNEGEDEVVWVIVRGSGGVPVVVNLEQGWGSSSSSSN